MTEYRISKYNPQRRENGIYQVHEWTSICDIGKMLDGGVLTYSQYKITEQSYIDCCIEILQKSGVTSLTVRIPEYYDDEIQLPSVLDTEDDIRMVIMSCLQEKCWTKLETNNFFIHFGYDYYVYVGTQLPHTLVEETVKKYNLFCEIFSSPYLDRNTDDV